MEKRIKPFISVIIPVFNRIKYIEEAINSALIQPEVAEVIVVDDGSKDGSLELCLKMSRTNEKVKVFSHKFKKNKGIAASRNLGIKNASSDWIAFLDSDDYYLPGRFETATQLIREDEMIDGVYSKSAYFKNSEKSIIQKGGLRIKVSPSDLFETLIKNDYGSFNTPTILLKKDLLTKCKGFDERLVMCDDVQMWNKCALLGKLIYDTNEDALVHVRLHDDNIWSGKETKTFDYYASHYLMLFYLIPFVLNQGSHSQKKKFFEQVLMDYKVFYRVLSPKMKKQWYLKVFPKIIKILKSKKIRKNQQEFTCKLQKWCVETVKKEIKNKQEKYQAFMLQIIPRSIKEKIKSSHEA